MVLKAWNPIRRDFCHKFSSSYEDPGVLDNIQATRPGWEISHRSPDRSRAMSPVDNGHLTANSTEVYS
ncbi:hypothetical protein N7466_005592 [Penicillium verhagenii]|uniref:uncharacterized protein n=1 Tax=Penicillium verhagenii TaxID=1562060 RepID=UPI002545A728|nr:uncharacterized protein N7466_005592 [Penicillium verhagenii]KAJ5930099.1 hypothetical protein N7466_005592 [Penicillium verhagenii]